MSVTIKKIFQNERKNIIRELFYNYSRQRPSPYKDFITSDSGYKRICIFIDLIIESLDGNWEKFFSDQKDAGYERAISGFDFDNVSKSYFMLPQTLNKFIKANSYADEQSFCNEILDLNQILLKGFSAISNSFLKTREEQLNEKVKQIHELYEFTHSIISKNKIENVINFTMSKLKQIVGITESFLFLENNSKLKGIIIQNNNRNFQNQYSRYINNALSSKSIIFVDLSEEIHINVDPNLLIKMILVPISIYGRGQGVIILHDKERGFYFKNKGLGYINQFIDVMTVSLKNILMLDEINMKSNKLQLLTKKMLTFQEDERKRLASDIHDTIAQNLTSVGLKVQYCKELLLVNPKAVDDELDHLSELVNNAIDQSRRLISSLRPDLIDTLGLVAALEKHIAMYEHNTGIRVLCNLPKSFNKINYEFSICLFRTAQEALINIYKHAKTNFAKINLKKNKDRAILTIQDYGKGCDKPYIKSVSNSGERFGLLSIMERVESLNGEIHIKSKKDEGFCLEVMLPLL